MFMTAELIGTSCGLHEEAVLAASQVGPFEARHYIRKAPRPMQPYLCKVVGIDLEADDQGAIRAATKESVIKELDNIETKLYDLEKRFQEYEEFLRNVK